MTYRHILLATDFSPDTAILTARARALAGSQSRLSLMHVIEPLALAYGAEVPVDLGSLQQELSRQAQLQLDHLAQQISVADADRILATGSIAREILRVASERDVDLIVLGRHSKRGLAALLGSTASAVLHHAPCDVLAVHIGTP